MLRSSESVGCILNEWQSVDFEAAAGQIIFTHQLPDLSVELFKECEQLMNCCSGHCSCMLSCNVRGYHTCTCSTYMYVCMYMHAHACMSMCMHV